MGNYINHIALVLDASGSMAGRERDVIAVADNQIAHLAQRSKELDQETRVTVYVFVESGKINCVYYDKDVLRMPSLAGQYRPTGRNTPLIDATLKALDDLSQTPELYGDHSFLTYVLTDGGENASSNSGTVLANRISSLPDHWTIAAFVPNQVYKHEAKRFGFPADNIAIWDTSASVTEVGRVIREATDRYMTARATGVRGSKNLFNMSVGSLSKRTVSGLTKLHPGQYRWAEVKEPGPIAEFVEGHTHRAYRLGEAFYQLTKTEKIQAAKQIAIMDRRSRDVYTGDDARNVLGLPDHEVKVAPTSHPEYEIFVQSTSVNRKLVAGTKVLLIG